MIEAKNIKSAEEMYNIIRSTERDMGEDLLDQESWLVDKGENFLAWLFRTGEITAKKYTIMMESLGYHKYRGYDDECDLFSYAEGSMLAWAKSYYLMSEYAMIDSSYLEYIVKAVNNCMMGEELKILDFSEEIMSVKNLSIKEIQNIILELEKQ